MWCDSFSLWKTFGSCFFVFYGVCARYSFTFVCDALRFFFFFLCLWGRTKRRRRKKRGELAMRIGDDPVVSGSYWQCKTKNCGQGSVRPFHFYPDCFLSAFFGYDSWRVSIDWFFARSYLYTEHEGAAHFHVMLRNTDRKMFVILSVKSFATIRNPGLKLREKQNCQGIWCRKFSIPGDLGKREAGCVYIN